MAVPFNAVVFYTISKTQPSSHIGYTYVK